MLFKKKGLQSNGIQSTLFVAHAKQGWHIGIMTQAASSSSVSSSSLASHFWFPIDNSSSDVSISFKLYRSVKHHYVQVKFEKRVNQQNFD